MRKDDEGFDFLSIRRHVRAKVKNLISGIDHELLGLFHTRGRRRREPETQQEKCGGWLPTSKTSMSTDTAAGTHARLNPSGIYS